MQKIQEKLSGIVQRVTYHNPDNGWSVLRVSPHNSPAGIETVTVHQTRVFAGATMEFHGSWTHHARFGRQFTAERAVEKKPATDAALEKYLGSGLIKGVGPVTARRIVRFFKEQTLEVFEDNIQRLVEVPGIATKKLAMIESAWREHRVVREVMMFLQTHGISTLFAVRIYKKYGDTAIEIVSGDPYRLAGDFYGIGFFSADQVALSLGFAEDCEQRLIAAIRHILAAAREEGHCYLREEQIGSGVNTLLGFDAGMNLSGLLQQMEDENQLRVRLFSLPDLGEVRCYYAKSLYYDEEETARRLHTLAAARGEIEETSTQIDIWIEEYCGNHRLQLSWEQRQAVHCAASTHCSVLTGGPGCGKTTTTQVIVRIFERLGKKVLLAAPTGRAAQRMGEVIGREAKTLHRLLEWQGGGFKKNEKQFLDGDCVVVDECSMLDISLTASLLKALPPHCCLLLIGDADQLPSVGAGNVLRDIITSGSVPVAMLTEVFRQARASRIIQYAHEINSGRTPWVESPFKRPAVWKEKEDCLFLDSEEATKEQLRFITKVKKLHSGRNERAIADKESNPFEFHTAETIRSSWEPDFVIPDKFQHVDLDRLNAAEGDAAQLREVLAKVHPWSTLHYGFGAVETIKRLYLEWIPKYYGDTCEIQILSPMTRGSLGTLNLNQLIQDSANPAAEGKAQLQVGQRIFRVGDRVIHRKNNYELGVFNGDIGRVVAIDGVDLSCLVRFFPDMREVKYQKDDIFELDLAYAITIHKSQGSEFEVVILPIHTQHFKMLFQNLLYTGLTRARKLAVLVGTRKAMAMAVRRQDTSRRQTGLVQLLSME